MSGYQVRMAIEARVEREADGVCVECAGERDGESLRCAKCRAAQAGRIRAYRLKRIAAGICVHCKAPATRGLQLCTAHQRAESQRQQAAKAERAEKRRSEQTDKGARS